MTDHVETYLTHNGALWLIEPESVKTPRRAFKSVVTESGKTVYEWAYFADLHAHQDRARTYGWASTTLPATMTNP